VVLGEKRPNGSGIDARADCDHHSTGRRNERVSHGSAWVSCPPLPRSDQLFGQLYDACNDSTGFCAEGACSAPAFTISREQSDAPSQAGDPIRIHPTVSSGPSAGATAAAVGHFSFGLHKLVANPAPT